MSKIPNYIIKKIEKHNALVERAAKLEEEIDEWYEKQLLKRKDIVDYILEENFTDIKCDLSATFVSEENMRYNLELIKEQNPPSGVAPEESSKEQAAG